MNDTSINIQPQAQAYLTKVTDLKEQFLSVLEDFSKYYVYYHKNPEVDEYQQFYLNSKSQLQNINKQLVKETNSVESAIENLSYSLTRMNAKLEYEKMLQGELVQQINGLTNSKNGSSVMLDDTTSIYNKQYFRNLSLFLGIVVVGSLIPIRRASGK